MAGHKFICFVIKIIFKVNLQEFARTIFFRKYQNHCEHFHTSYAGAEIFYGREIFLELGHFDE